jgi:hypothetical protein
MHFLRLLRIFIPLLVIAALVAGVIVVLSSRSELQSSRRTVDEAWSQLQRQLDTRFNTLKVVDETVRTVPGPLHTIVVQIDAIENKWHDQTTNGGSVSSQVTTANSLEALARRLVQAARASRRLQGQPGLAAVNTFAATAPPSGAGVFEIAVSRYEKERNRPARRLAASILGYKSVPAYDASGSA